MFVVGCIDLKEVQMRFHFSSFEVEIIEFLCVETLEEIDYGVLDLSKIRDYKLREVLEFFVELLSLELRVNYLENDTGIFRVSAVGDRYYYREFGHVIEADSISDLKESVLSENRIWYVFDEVMAEKLVDEWR